MKFWDASALIALLVEEPHTRTIVDIARKDGDVAAWWGSSVECFSAFARLRREGVISLQEEDHIRHMISLLSDAWTEIEPTNEIRIIAERMLLVHPLRAADALQLAAALVWSGRSPKGQHFVCLDGRLRAAARNEGFMLLPEDKRLAKKFPRPPAR
jgi:predicted nucleic acid-binding protein